MSHKKTMLKAAKSLMKDARDDAKAGKDVKNPRRKFEAKEAKEAKSAAKDLLKRAKSSHEEREKPKRKK